jgi:hypothetical protein
MHPIAAAADLQPWNVGGAVAKYVYGGRPGRGGFGVQKISIVHVPPAMDSSRPCTPCYNVDRVSFRSPLRPGREVPTPRLMGVFLVNKKVDAGLDSTDRNNKATLPFTSPGQSSQSSARVLSRRAVKLQCALADTHF